MLIAPHYYPFSDFEVFCGLLGAGSPGYTYLGCFKDMVQGAPYGDGFRGLPFNPFRSAGWTVDQCAVAARDRGYPVFALQHTLDCFMGTIADVAKMASQKTTDDACSGLPCTQPGVPCPLSLNKVYFLEGTSDFQPLLASSTFLRPTLPG
jgi:hypothetical protein